MAAHRHSDDAWRVRVDDEHGKPRGAGVLLDERHVLTCAHVLGKLGDSPDESVSRVRITSAVCHPEWSIAARVVPDSWVYRNGTRRGDVTLLELDTPTPCGASAKLWQAPISGVKVRAYGFPRADPYGIAVDAELAGSGGREGEWGLLNRIHVGAQWIEEGYSGAGVVALDGEFAGRVIGIVVRDYNNHYDDDKVKAAWMLPTETMLSYLRQLRPYVAGERATVLPEPDDAPPDDELIDPLRLALTQELVGLLGGRWSGTVVITGGATGTGTSWLVRLVRTADPAARVGASDAELSGAPRDTVLGLGVVDAAYDARGRSLAEVRQYLADRFGFPASEPDLLLRLLRRKPPVCLVIGAVDRAADPDALVAALVGPLALRARSRGIRLVLGFDGRPPSGLAYEVSLGPEPLAANTLERATEAEAEQCVARLSAAEDAASRLHAEWGLQFFAPLPLPHCLAPQLRVRLAVAGGAGPSAELAAIRDRAAAALGDVDRFDRRMRHLIAGCVDLRSTLEVHQVRAERFFDAEDPGLMALDSQAVRALWTVPIDLAAAGAAVQAYADEVNRRIDEEQSRDEV